MKVRAVRNRYMDCPPHVAWKGYPETETHLTIGKEYEVYAMSFYGGCLMLLVIRDAGFQSFEPSWFFEITDRSISADWHINLFNHKLHFDNELHQAIIGPEFITSDVESYEAILESYPSALRSLVDHIGRSEKACPCCSIAILNKIGDYDICPVCDWVDDPFQRNDVNLADGVNASSLIDAREIWKKMIKR